MREGRFELSGFALRMIAMLCMLADHAGATFFPDALWLRCVGRLAFPIFAFLVAEGSVYTHDKKKYLLRLFALAAVSEIPFDLMVSDAVFSFGHQNVVWTFLVSLAAIFLSEKLLSEKRELAGGLVLAAAAVLCELCRTDYGAVGVLTVLLFKQRGAIRTRFSRHRAGAYCVLLNHNATAFLNRKALSARALSREKSSTLNEEDLSFIKAEDAGGPAPVKDDNAEKGQRTEFKAGSYSVPLLKRGEKLPLAAGIAAVNGLLAFGADYPAQLCAVAALVPIFAYKGQQGPHGRALRLVFYGFYPVHMIVLAALSG